MRKFFKNINSIHQFTMELEYHQDNLQCKKCQKSDQFISHGYVYKKKNNGGKRTVGKRIFCSNRFGKTGCGCTHRFYLADEIPRHQFNAAHVFIFLTQLFIGSSIQKAYTAATRALDPRNAYRWLKKMGLKLINYRHVLNQHPQIYSNDYPITNKRLRLLLPTLKNILSSLGTTPCAQYQLQYQKSFI